MNSVLVTTLAVLAVTTNVGAIENSSEEPVVLSCQFESVPDEVIYASEERLLALDSTEVIKLSHNEYTCSATAIRNEFNVSNITKVSVGLPNGEVVTNIEPKGEKATLSVDNSGLLCICRLKLN